MKKLKIILIILAFSAYTSLAQQTLTLPQAIALAQENSLQASINKNSLGIAYQAYRIQHSQLFPQLSLNANLPGYNSSITSVTQPDGTIKFTTVEQAYSTLGLSLNQKIPLTGGTFTASSNINRFDRLSGNKTSTFNTQPFVLGLSQPLFRFNEMAYTQRLAVQNKLLADKTFLQKQEQLALDISILFFKLLQSQNNLITLSANKGITDTLLFQSKIKLNLGKIEEDEYLQIQLKQLSIANQVKESQNGYNAAKFDFCSALNIPDSSTIALVNTDTSAYMPLDLNASSIAVLVNEYKQTNPDFGEKSISKFQACSNLSRYKFNKLPSINVLAGYGSNQSAPMLSDAYQNLLTQRNVTLGISVPIIGAGVNNANIKMASYQLQNLDFQVQMLERQIRNELVKQIQSLNLSYSQLGQAKLMESIAARRYEISKSKYLAGRITYTEFLLAQNQAQETKQNQLNLQAAYWKAYYQIRLNTLYDIKTKKSLFNSKNN